MGIAPAGGFSKTGWLSDSRASPDLAAEFSGFHGAKTGQLELKLAIASNDTTGLWQIRVRELASGLTRRVLQ
jgi:hypothetical protein